MVGPRPRRSGDPGQDHRTDRERHPITSPTEVPTDRSSHRDDFAELSKRMREQGLLGRRRGYYAIKIAATVTTLTVLVAVVVVLGDSWWTLLPAVGIAFTMAQMGFIGHDAGHRQICTRRRDNDLIGLVAANLLTGFSFGWWLTKHNRHHAHTNRPDKDPDLVAGALVYTEGQVARRRAVGRMFGRMQAVTVFPLLFLEALNLHLASVLAIGRRRDRAALAEGAMLAVHLAVFIVGPFLVMSPLRAVLFVAVSQSLFGFYLGASFVTNHVGMPTLGGTDDLGFLRRQVLTSRNLSGRSLTGFIYGGLDTQIEHHLFPTMPRPNLRRARELVRPFCAEQGIEYAEQSPWRAYREVLHHLRSAGAGRATPAIG